MDLRKFLAPEVIFGTGSRNLAGQYSKNLGIKNALLVTDNVLKNSKWVKDVKKSLEKSDIKFTVFSDVSPNPRAREVMLGVEVYKANSCDGIVSIGGGSPMDCAKGIGIVISNRKHILEFEGIDLVTIPVPPLVFIPTTAGSSADVSQFAIITNLDELNKIAIVSKTIVPDVALIDPETTLSMDSYLTACTGMDAMVHAIEAYVSNASSIMTDLHALEAIKVISEYLPRVIREKSNIEYKEKMMYASMEAGFAFSNAILGAVHSMSHSLGGFLDLPHGECNAILLDHVVDFNYKIVPERFDKISQAMGLDTRGMIEKEKKDRLLKEIRDLKVKVGITNKLQEVGVKEQDIPILAGKAIHDPCMLTNPREANKRDLEVIYEGAR